MSKRLIGTRKWFPQKDTIYGKDKAHPNDNPYMTRITLGRLRYHIFHRGDLDPYPHDHQWSFVTFPLTSYVEEVLAEGQLRANIVRAFRFHYRHATFKHRVIGRWAGEKPRHPQQAPESLIIPGKAVHTIVCTSAKFRDWGFWPELGKCFIPWRDYVFKGKSACD